jgi:hypothetical protein
MQFRQSSTDRNGAISKSGDRLGREALFIAAHNLLTRAIQ